MSARFKRFFNGKNSKNQLEKESIIGGSVEFVKKHIERQFKKGMSWENYHITTWHIDHIIPLSSAKNEEELLKLFHYTNLRPLWAKENISKSDKIPTVQLKMTI